MARTKSQALTEAMSATANVLLDTAEQLFAKNGIENVSIRQIVMASGHGNLSGAHYHFGSREELIRKLLMRRMEVVDAVRHRVLDDVVAAGQQGDPWAIVNATVHVLDLAVRNYPWGRDYVLVIAQALFSPRIQLLNNLDSASITGLVRTSAMMRPLLPHLDDDCFEERMRMLRYHCTFEVARWLQENELTAQTQSAFERHLVRVAEFVVGGLTAPSRAGDKPGKPGKTTRRKPAVDAVTVVPPVADAKAKPVVRRNRAIKLRAEHG